MKNVKGTKRGTKYPPNRILSGEKVTTQVQGTPGKTKDAPVTSPFARGAIASNARGATSVASTATDGQRVALTTTEPRPVPAGRVSLDSVASYAFGTSWTVQPPTDFENFWRLNNLDANHLDYADPRELLDMLADLSPEISYAIWQFHRLCNPGYEYKAYSLDKPGSEHRAAKKHIDDLFLRLREEYGSVDILLGRFFMGAYLRGGVCAELVLDQQARETVDIVAPDPSSIRFRKRVDPVRKEVWQPGQMQREGFVPLDIPTFRYLPVDPAPASPYGRPLAAPALFIAIFSLSLLHDVKRVIMQQGYKRMDIVLDTEQAMDAYTYDAQGYTTPGRYIEGAIEQIKSVYRLLEPDDAFIHTDIFSLNNPVGTIDSDSIGAIDRIMERLEKTITRALKTNGVVLDTSNNTNETDSNRKWEIHAAGIKSIQHLVENMLESLLTTSCRAKGIQAKIQFRFAELRAAEQFRDEQTRQLRIQNSRLEWEAGYSSQDEAANKAVNHDADAPEPRDIFKPTELVEDNNSGNEALNQGEDDRQRPLVIPQVFGTVKAFTNGKH